MGSNDIVGTYTHLSTFGFLMAILFVFVIYLCFSAVASDKYKTLPSLYHLEDYSSCVDRGDFYCKTVVRLKSTHYENNTLWKLIQESTNDLYSHDRSIIHRAICVPKTEAGNFSSVKKFSELHINEELNGAGLFSDVIDVTCTTKDAIKITSYDIIFLISLVIYILLIVYATVHDILKRIHKSNTGTTNDRSIIALSLISNWEKICNVKGNEDFNKLKSIQGIRFFNMLLIISLHTIISSSMVYRINPDDVRALFCNAILKHIFVLDMFLVQTFFLISSWLVTFQIYNIYKEHGEFTIKQAFILIINRFFRIGVSSTVMIIFLTTSWYRLSEGPLGFDNNNMTQTACQQNGWQTFFYINNHLFFKDSCHPPSWYLAVDFQLYVMAIATIYVILRFKLNEWKVLSFLLFVSYILYGTIIYISDMGITVHVNVNILLKYKLFQYEDIRILYTSTYCSWATSIVGIGFGIIYTKNKNRSAVNSKIVSVLWLLVFFGLPSAVIFIVEHDFNRIVAAVIGPLAKPMFSLGIGVGILGMSHNIGGIIKRLCENKYIVMISNISFSVYIFQSLILFSKGNFSYSMLDFGSKQVIKYFLFMDAPLSIAFALFCSLLFEQPGINLQKIFLPQISRNKQLRHKE